MSQREANQLIREQILRHIDTGIYNSVWYVELIVKIRTVCEQPDSEAYHNPSDYLDSLIHTDCPVFHRINHVLKELTDRGILVQSQRRPGLCYGRPA